MSEAINIYSINARGLGDKYKWEAVFSWLRGNGPGICLFQESHTCSASEKQWKGQWGGPIHFSHGTSNSKGVAILISPQLNTSVHSVKTDPENSGRFLLVQCSFESNKYIVNIYSPIFKLCTFFFLNSDFSQVFTEMMDSSFNIVP